MLSDRALLPSSRQEATVSQPCCRHSAAIARSCASRLYPWIYSSLDTRRYSAALILSAVTTLAKVARGEGDKVTMLDKRGELVEVELPVPYRARVNAGATLLDRFGMVALKQPIENAPARQDDVDEVTAADIDKMSIEELRAYSERRKAALARHALPPRGRSA